LSNLMAANGKARTKTTTTTTTKRERTATDGAVSYFQRTVDLPVGVILTARDRLNGAVQPWTSSTTRARELRSLRQHAKRELRKFERRGGQARRKAIQRVRRTRTRLERRARRAEGAVERRVREVETSVKENGGRVGGGLRKAQTSVQERVSSLA
jgi:hypothetical protein